MSCMIQQELHHPCPRFLRFRLLPCKEEFCFLSELFMRCSRTIQGSVESYVSGSETSCFLSSVRGIYERLGKTEGNGLASGESQP